jgi:hypothetical protein
MLLYFIGYTYNTQRIIAGKSVSFWAMCLSLPEHSLCRVIYYCDIMKLITLSESNPQLGELVALAQAGPVLLLAPDGTTYIFTHADTFDTEVAQLQTSAAFQAFLDERSSRRRPRRPLAEVAQELDHALASEASDER